MDLGKRLTKNFFRPYIWLVIWEVNLFILFFISLLNFSQIMLIIEVNNHKNLPKLLVNKKIIDINMIELHL